MYKIFKEFDTSGQLIFEYPYLLECKCNLTGGCSKCNPFLPFKKPIVHLFRHIKPLWEEDIELAEEGMDEYNEILKEEDKK